MEIACRNKNINWNSISIKYIVGYLMGELREDDIN